MTFSDRESRVSQSVMGATSSSRGRPHGCRVEREGENLSALAFMTHGSFYRGHFQPGGRVHVGLSVCVVVCGGCTVRGSVHDNCLSEVWHRMKWLEIDF